MNKWIKLIGIFFLLIVAFACRDSANTSEKLVARVGDKTLYLSEINNFVPKNIGIADSTLMAEDYIKKWIQKQLLIKKAEENLTPQQLNVTNELTEYRNSLIIYKYKNEMVAQKMDTTVSENEIRDFYDNNQETFILNRTIAKTVFIKIAADVADRNLIRMYCSNDSELSLRELREYCIQYASSFDTFNDNWVELYRVMDNVPNNIGNYDQYITRNNLFEANDSGYYYLVWIRDYKLKGNPAPVEYVSEQIKNLILNSRKLAFLKSIEQDIYNEGIRNNKFNIYDVD